MCPRQRPYDNPGKKCRSEGTQACLQSFGLCLRHIFTRAVKQSSVRSECKTKPRDFFLAFEPGFVNFLPMNWEMSACWCGDAVRWFSPLTCQFEQNPRTFFCQQHNDIRPSSLAIVSFTGLLAGTNTNAILFHFISGDCKPRLLGHGGKKLCTMVQNQCYFFEGICELWIQWVANLVKPV